MNSDCQEKPDSGPPGEVNKAWTSDSSGLPYSSKSIELDLNKSYTETSSQKGLTDDDSSVIIQDGCSRKTAAIILTVVGITILGGAAIGIGIWGGVQNSKGKSLPPDCQNGSKFVCSDGTCIDKAQVCDQRKDCPSSEDETSALCPPHLNNNSVSKGPSADSFDDRRTPGFTRPVWTTPQQQAVTPSRACSSSEFRCNDGRCIPTWWTCNGGRDCPNGEDETVQLCSYCRGSLFKCNNGSCIDSWRRCNGNRDCTHGEDENIELCSNMGSTRTTPGSNFVTPSCTSTQYRCTDGTCISTSWLCDGDRDCSGGEDETVQRCSSCRGGLYACNNGSCISPYKKCDGVRDCSNGEDESTTLCTVSTSTTRIPSTTPSCGSNYFRCNDGRCIPLYWLCDGGWDCSGGEDETILRCGYCRFGLFQCNNGSCINPNKKCNGIRDCSNGEDESTTLCTATTTTRAPTTTPGCTSSQFRCNTGYCIPSSWKCDAGRDCPGGEDESVQNCRYCRGNLFQCNNGSCIYSYRKCDGVRDCSNGEDESTALCATTTRAPITLPFCTSSQFRCNSGQCIPSSWKCDGGRDCPGGEDESVQNCGYCRSTLYQCNNGSCIYSYKKCDGIRDCSNGEDESAALCATTTRAPTAAPVCSSSQFRCTDGKCISTSWLCDGDRDCSGGEDETVQRCSYCRGTLIPCNNGSCISSSLRCNGVRDCSDGEDENNATCGGSGCSAGQFRCNNGRCISTSWLCDGGRDCSGGEDETVQRCGYCHGTLFQCNNGSCIHYYQKCDGVRDCSNGEDESSTACATTTRAPTTTPSCTSTQFRCNNGRCISSSWLCDGDRDCSGGEDETVQKCSYCRGTLIPCNNGSCISSSLRCNGVRDCSEGEDESNATCGGSGCSSSQFRCNNGRCISSSWLCDGDRDCSGGEDETVQRCGVCRKTLFQCANGSCISSSKICDNIYDCGQGEDENATMCNGRCPGGLYRCPSDRSCISQSLVCDRINDCPDGFDEKNCTSGCRTTEFKCNDGKCIDLDWTCDGTKDCDNGEDEKLPTCQRCSTSQFQCVSNRPTSNCISLTQQCDGATQCPDASDEAKCVNIGADGPSNPGNRNQPVTVTYRSEKNYAICADDWSKAWSDNICKLLGYKESDVISDNLAVPANGRLLKLNSGASSSSSFLTSISVTGSCNTGRVIGVSCRVQECGLRAVNPNTTGPYIINGQEAARGAWPWQVSIGYSSFFSYDSFCGGSLINNRWVLTAAHCVEDLSGPSSIAIKAGTLNLTSTSDPDARLLYADRIIAHPGYLDSTSRNVIINDVALIRLSSPVTFTETIRPICVAPPDVDLNKFKVCVATGWGRIRKYGAVPTKMRQGKMKIRTIDECYQAYSLLFGTTWTAARSDFNYMFCTGNLPADGGVDTCNGDSGGPLACQDQQGVWTVVGATSYGFGQCELCAFTRLSYYSSWISSQISLNS